MKCQCRWIKNGQETPDNNEAIGMAVCFTPSTFGEEGSKPFPICFEHANSKGKWWKIIPLTGKSVEESHYLVRWDAKHFINIPNTNVIESVRKAFDRDANKILDDLQFDCINKCFFFIRNGVYTGIELDGYMHQ